MVYLRGAGEQLQRVGIEPLLHVGRVQRRDDLAVQALEHQFGQPGGA